MASRFLPLVLMLAASAPLHAAQPAYRTFQDWVVACDNVAQCEMLVARDTTSLWLSLRREAGPDGAVRLRLEAGREIRLAALRLDGSPLRLDPSNWQHTRGDGYAELVTEDLETARTLLRTIRNGDTLRLGDDEQAPSLSLAGISASLLFLDEAQGRLNNVTALLHTGDEPAGAVPDAPAVPRLRPAVPLPPDIDPEQAKQLAADVRRHQAPRLGAQDCHAGTGDNVDSVAPLGPDEALVMLECGRGAYQWWFLLFRTPLHAPAEATWVQLPLPLALGEPGYQNKMIEEFFNVDYEPGQGMLSHFAKGRGLGDCGRSTRWIFDGDDFQLHSLHYLGRCSGGPPGEWPRLWVAEAAGDNAEAP